MAKNQKNTEYPAGMWRRYPWGLLRRDGLFSRLEMLGVEDDRAAVWAIAHTSAPTRKFQHVLVTECGVESALMAFLDDAYPVPAYITEASAWPLLPAPLCERA